MSALRTGGAGAPARRRGYVLTAGVLLVMMLGGTLPVPLYVLYEKQMGFGPLGVTVVFAAYVLGTLVALVAIGDLSDHIGRRKVLAASVACAVASTVLFLAATDIGLLVVARVLSGLAAGSATGTATAALVELQPRRDHGAAAVVASGSNMTGLGLGPLIAGVFAEYIAMPTHSVFWAYLGLCALALAALRAIPEAVRNPDGAISFRPRLAAPARMRAVLLGACLGLFAAFTVLGLFSSLVPTFVHGILGVHDFVLIGGVSFLVFVTAAISQAVSARLPSRRSVVAGLPLLVVCLAALESALATKAPWLFVIGTIVGGVAVGLIFRGGLSELNRLAGPRQRAAVVSTFFVAGYVGLGLPAVLTGLISLLIGPLDASAWISGLATAVVAVALVVVLRTFGTARTPEPPSPPADSWCCPWRKLAGPPRRPSRSDEDPDQMRPLPGPKAASVRHRLRRRSTSASPRPARMTERSGARWRMRGRERDASGTSHSIRRGRTSGTAADAPSRCLAGGTPRSPQ